MESFKFYGPEDSFYGSVWWYFKSGQVMGHFPVKLSSTSRGIEAKTTFLSSAYYLTLLSLCTTFVVYAHLNMNHDHLHHTHTIILRVAFFQVAAISVTALIGSINSFVMRHNLVIILTKLNELADKLRSYGIEIPYRKYKKLILLGFIVQTSLLVMMYTAVCGVIHPYGKPLWDQFLCLMVNIQ